MDRAGPTSTGAAVAPVTIQPPAIAPATSAALPSTDEPAEGAEPDPLLETPEAEADPALTGAAPAAEQPQPVIAGDSVTATSQPDAA
ncbi:MAG: hypothetical protein ACKOW1_05145 [Novosphingobium sp.]